MNIQLGVTYKDKVTGFVGVATGRVEYLIGCNQVLLVPPVGKDGELLDAQRFDERLCEPQRKARIVLDNSGGAGFDQLASKR